MVVKERSFPGESDIAMLMSYIRRYRNRNANEMKPTASAFDTCQDGLYAC
jgi:hypothetical protein